VLRVTVHVPFIWISDGSSVRKHRRKNTLPADRAQLSKHQPR
jgi:hypothetical protein